MGEFVEGSFDRAIELDSNKSLYLIKIPKHVDISKLDGVSIHDFNDTNRIEPLNSPVCYHNIEVDCSSNIEGFRPIIGGKGKDASIGPEFAGCLTIKRVIQEIEVSQDILPVLSLYFFFYFILNYFCCLFSHQHTGVELSLRTWPFLFYPSGP